MESVVIRSGGSGTVTDKHPASATLAGCCFVLTLLTRSMYEELQTK